MISLDISRFNKNQLVAILFERTYSEFSENKNIYSYIRF